MKKKVILFALSLVILSFFTAEIILRNNGWLPGKIKPFTYFIPQDELIILNGIYCDTDGIMKIAPEAAKNINHNVQNGIEVTKQQCEKNNWLGEVFEVGNDYIHLPDNSFYKLIKKVKSKHSKDTIDSLILNYSKSPINEDGFRSIAFKPIKTKKVKVLLIGDSFTWGHSTTNKTNSFADELLANDYVIYNAGITGTDPAQYAAIAKNYVPLLQPDIVIVNFYMGNDLVNYQREVRENQPLFTFTNAGAVFHAIRGAYIHDVHTAYQFALQDLEIPHSKNWVNWLSSKTAIGTVIWFMLKKINLVDYKHEAFESVYQSMSAELNSPPYLGDLEEIKSICTLNDTRFILSIIPDFKNSNFYRFPANYSTIFKSFNYLLHDFKKSDFHPISLHLNDTGNKNYAKFLTKVINEK